MLKKSRSIGDLDGFIFRLLSKYDFSKEKILKKMEEYESRISRTRYTVNIGVLIIFILSILLYIYIFFRDIQNIDIIYVHYLIILSLSISINFVLIGRIILNFFKLLSKELPRLLEPKVSDS
jgi:hypothetical protein